MFRNDATSKPDRLYPAQNARYFFLTAKNDVNFSHAQYQAPPHAFSKHFAKWLLLKNVLLAKAYM